LTSVYFSEIGLFNRLQAIQTKKSGRAPTREGIGEWHSHFKVFFEYLDTQKIRTPKGLDWLSAQYPRLTQNDLMFEMQGISVMHCTIWTEGVREIVSAQDADVKFIVSDHPVTIYNYAIPPDIGVIALYSRERLTVVEDDASVTTRIIGH
jgi:hypothetical protein